MSYIIKGLVMMTLVQLCVGAVVPDVANNSTRHHLQAIDYIASRDMTTCPVALQNCLGSGPNGHLLRIETECEQDAIRHFIAEHVGSLDLFWTAGIYDPQQNCFTWGQGGPAIGDVPWDQGHPIIGSATTGVAVHFQGGDLKFRTIVNRFQAEYRYICEFDI